MGGGTDSDSTSFAIMSSSACVIVDPGGCGDTRLELFNCSNALAVDNNKVFFLLFLAVISMAELCNLELIIIVIIDTTRQGHRIIIADDVLAIGASNVSKWQWSMSKAHANEIELQFFSK